MSNYVVSDASLGAVADAIREKGGTTAALEYPEGFVQAISDIETGEAGIPEAVKTALLEMFEHVAYIDDSGNELYNALYNALYAGGATLMSIEATISQGYEPICTTDNLDLIRRYMTVMARFSNGAEIEMDDYTLSGTLTDGTATVSVEYMGKTDTVQVEVTQLPTGYTHRECVVANGSQYIDSGLTETDMQNYGVAYKAMRTSTTTGSTHLLSAKNMYVPLFRLNSGADKCFVTCNRLGNTTYTKTDDIASNIEIGRAYEVEAFKNGSESISVDGIDCMIWPNGTVQPSSSNKLMFFTFGGAPNNTNYRFIGKFYYMKLFNGNAVVHDYIPCTNGNGVAGLYDAVSDRFLAPYSGTLSWE